MKTELNNNEKLSTEQETPPIANVPLGDVLSRLHKAEWWFRLEDDENGFYLSIINRGIYPRIWADSHANGDIKVICESAENILNRTIAISEKDWSERWSGETIDECLYQAYEWMSIKNIA